MSYVEGLVVRSGLVEVEEEVVGRGTLRESQGERTHDGIDGIASNHVFSNAKIWHLKFSNLDLSLCRSN